MKLKELLQVLDPYRDTLKVEIVDGEWSDYDSFFPGSRTLRMFDDKTIKCAEIIEADVIRVELIWEEEIAE